LLERYQCIYPEKLLFLRKSWKFYGFFERFPKIIHTVIKAAAKLINAVTCKKLGIEKGAAEKTAGR